MSKATQDILDALHGQLAKTLTDKIKNGEATAADLNVARQFLKDNGVDAVPREASPLAELAAALPFPSDNQDEDRFLN